MLVLLAGTDIFDTVEAVNSQMANPKAMNSRQAGHEIKRFLATGEVGFLACAMSPWHAMGVDAWVHSLRASGDRRRGVVILLPHVRDGLVIDEDSFPLCQADGAVDFLSLDTLFVRGGVRRWLEVGGAAMRLLRLWLSRPGSRATGLPVLSVGTTRDTAAGVFMLAQIGCSSLLNKYRIRLVVLDEGLASYRPHASRSAEARLERTSSGRIARAGWLDAILYSRWHRLHGSIARSYEIQERFAFRPEADTGTLRVNPEVAADYRMAALAGSEEDSPEHGGRPCALVVTAPHSEVGAINSAADMAVLATVVDRLISAGFHVRIKPHPREAQDKYASLEAGRCGFCEIAPRQQAVERTFAYMHGRGIVVGMNSTSLLTASLLYGLKAYSYGEALFGRDGTSDSFIEVLKSLRAMAGEAILDFEKEFGPLS
jgi:hypothetical protein